MDLPLLARFEPRPRSRDPRGRPARGSRVVVFAVLALSVVGCDPVMNVQGTVVDGNGRPLANATVVLECPPKTWLRTDPGTRTDGAGAFRFEGLGCPTRACRVKVTPEGTAPIDVALAPFCTDSAYQCRDSCAAAMVAVRAPAR